MPRKSKKRIFRNLSFWRIIPNLATLSALLVGFTQVRFALENQWEFAVISVVIAAFLDATDGRLARLFDACSRFGAELDSLSDFAVFGLCPAIVMYLYSLSTLNRIGWAVSIFFASCMCLRLARFNTHDIENVKTPLSGKFFIGVPAPAGAILVLFPIILFNAFELEFFRNSYFCAINVLVSGLLCISRIPTLSIKKFHIQREQYTLFMLCIIFAISLVFAYTWKAFSVIVLAYIVSIFVCSKKAKRILANDKIPSHQ
ncbi:MAG: phosphatidylcholine/phosphatidylserine synthase [Holosporales bacterium]|jgi:CDP-diacylglycerol--serine O-phosphatidyltransferase|nr:phosphatidylcholine/phosphatidylserine synthase [Holosporales bacterium]